MEVTDAPVTQSEPTDVAAAEPEPPAAAQSEEMPTVSFSKFSVTSCRCSLVLCRIYSVPFLPSPGCCRCADRFGCAGRRTQVGGLRHAVSDAACCRVCGAVSRVAIEWTHCSRGLYRGLDAHYAAWKTFFNIFVSFWPSQFFFNCDPVFSF